MSTFSHTGRFVFLIVFHNIIATTCQNRLQQNEKCSKDSLEKLSSGLKINKAADDASGLAISEKMRGQMRGLTQASRNIDDGISLVQLADGALGEITNSLQRARELSVQAANGILTEEDRQAIQGEIDHIVANIDNIAHNTSFNDSILPLVPVTKNPLPPPPPTPEVDIVFFIDNSASMDTFINQVKNGIDGFFTNLSTFSSAQIAMVDLTDDNVPPSQSYPFSNDISTLQSQLSVFSNTNSSLTKPYTRFQEAAPGGPIGTSLGYRPGANKIFIALTDTYSEADSPPYTKNSTSDLLEGTVVKAGYDSDDIQTFVFSFGNSSSPTSAYDDLVTTTGGTIFYPQSAADVTDALQNNLVTAIQNSVSSGYSTTEPRIVHIQCGPNAGHSMVLNLSDMRTTTLGISNLKVNPYTNALQAITSIDSALQNVVDDRAKYGAYQNRLEHAKSNVINQLEQVAASESYIRNADMAKELMKYQKSNILSQASQAMLTQANQQPQHVLSLLSNS